ncbi:MAG TPA: SCP2 sterol-binding domain-containing protein [Anaerolineales bacterium]|nr:SCP2 sterol-binding domain-containing protein [Anaerolineales bacterium]
MPLTIAELMQRMPAALDSEKAAGVDAVIHFKFTGAEPGEWNAVIKDGKAVVAQGIPHSKPTMTLTADSSDFLSLFTGQMDPMQAFMLGKIKLGGDLSQAMKLVQMFKVR